MRNNTILKTLLAALCSWPTISMADDKQIFRDAMFKNMAGFGGVFFSCRQAPEATPVGNSVCNNSIKDFSIKARKHRIKNDFLPFGLAQKELTKELLDRTRKLNSPLRLVVELRSAQTPEGYVGSARVSAEVAMGYAIDTSVPPGTPTSRPRSGMLSFWDRSIIASGESPERLSYALSEAIKLNMDAFFVEYLKQSQ